MTPTLSYIVCSSPRSGSSLLCDALGTTGIAGYPQELARPSWSDEIRIMRRLGVHSQQEFFQKALDVSTTPNGVFGTKIHALYTPALLNYLEWHRGEKFASLHEALHTTLPNIRYLYISRNDGTAQAVSFYRSLMTNEWWQYGDAALSPHDENVPFDQFGIKKCSHLLEAMNRYWEGYFAVHHIQPLRITYEDMSSDYERTALKALAHLGLPQVPIPPPVTKKMANERSRTWAKEFTDLERATPFGLAEGRPSWAPF